MEDEREIAENRPLELDWDKLLSSGAGTDDDDGPPTIEIVKTSARKESPAMAANESSVEQMTDHELLDRIQSTKRTISMFAGNVIDKGDKLRNSLQRLESESERRNRRRLQTIQLEKADGFEKPALPVNSCIPGGPKYFKGEDATSQDPTCSSFSSTFFKRMEENDKGRKPNAFEKEVSLLGPCSRQKMKNDRDFSKKQRIDERQPSRHSSSKWHDGLSREGGKRAISNSNEKDRVFSKSSQDIRESYFYGKKKDHLPASNNHDSRCKKEHTIVLDDEDQPQLVEILQQVEKPDESMKDTKIYYPSRHDLEAVEISYSDFDCLAPQALLRSNIMNFYIRYLQQHVSPTNRVMSNCHFFNTYFYNKLKEVLSCKGSSKDEFFVKFRRWWKGVNIFQKEYILIPINEDAHWSLVIICIPDKEEYSGPIVLHLDSLGFHSSESVFRNIKSFLVAEWNHLRRDVSCSDVPFPDSIWENLPRRIVDNPIVVPQQKNDYDCGLFVLYFMKRFVKDVSGRLKKKDLAMFGKKWFKPEEASGLRVKINKLLIKEFKNAQRTDYSLERSPSPPSSPPSSYEVVEV